MRPCARSFLRVQDPGSTRPTTALLALARSKVAEATAGAGRCDRFFCAGRGGARRRAKTRSARADEQGPRSQTQSPGSFEMQLAAGRPHAHQDDSWQAGSARAELRAFSSRSTAATAVDDPARRRPLVDERVAGTQRPDLGGTHKPRPRRSALHRSRGSRPAFLWAAPTSTPAWLAHLEPLVKARFHGVHAAFRPMRCERRRVRGTPLLRPGSRGAAGKSSRGCHAPSAEQVSGADSAARR